jgi:transcriptional regulator with XRE-family HTH domain
MDAERMLMQAADNKPRFDPWKLRILREARGMTGAQLSDACGWGTFGFQQVSRFETYNRPAGKVTLRRLTQALGCKDADLLSSGREFRDNKTKFEAWRNDGSPDLGKWLLKRSIAFTNDAAQLSALGRATR